MSKSLGNFKTIRGILENFIPEVLRFFLLGRHYRSPIDFSEEGLEEAEKNLKRFYETLLLLDGECARPAPKGGLAPQDLRDEYHRLIAGWKSALDDDLNTAAALGHCRGFAHLANRILEDKALRKNAGCREILEGIRALIPVWNKVFALLGQDPREFLDSLKTCRAKRRAIDPALVQTLLQKRLEARSSRDFSTADALRLKLVGLGVEVRDTPDGTLWDIA
jgi:cysteinyl-tRNA synthetase